MSKAQRTRSYIIERTASLFNTKGYAGTSINDICEVTGLTKGSVYGNFESKDDVALAVFDYNLDKVNQIVNSEVARKGTVKEKLLAYVAVYKDFQKYPFPDGGCPILNTAIEADDTHPELKRKAKEAIMAWRDALVALLEEGMRSGEIKQQLDPEQLALTIIAAIEGAIMIANVTGKLLDRNKVLASVEKLVKELD